MKNYSIAAIIVVGIIGVAALAWYKIQDNAASLQAGNSVAQVLTASTSDQSAVQTAPTPTPVSTPPSNATTHPKVTGAPSITSLDPSSATVGSTVTIHGTGFSATSNAILFGKTMNSFHRDGTPANQIAAVASTDGATLSFVVPNSGPSGILCDSSNHCIAVSAMRIIAGTYPVTVRNAAGTSNTATLTVTSGY